MKEIRLHSGSVTIVDDEDFDLLAPRKWVELNRSSKYTSYAATSDGSGPNRRTLYMHRAVMNDPQGMVIDHINGDGLDNRRSNLRICTRSENIWNSRISRRNSTGFKGVSRWIGKTGEVLFITTAPGGFVGKYATAEDAAMVYDAVARKVCGAFARLNFPDRRCSQMEQSGAKRAKTGLRGVHPAKNGYQVMIRGKYHGYFTDAISAAEAYDAEARRIWGERAKVNFPKTLALPA